MTGFFTSGYLVEDRERAPVDTLKVPTLATDTGPMEQGPHIRRPALRAARTADGKLLHVRLRQTMALLRE